MSATLTFTIPLPAAPPTATIPAVHSLDATDSDLLLRVGGGDRDAFETLYKRYARSVFGMALRRLGDRGTAEDAVQETFASVWRSAATYRPERGPGAPWLYAVARNAIAEMIRWLGDEAGLAPEPAYALCSAVVDLRISEIVDVPHPVVSALCPTDIFHEIRETRG